MQEENANNPEKEVKANEEVERVVEFQEHWEAEYSENSKEGKNCSSHCLDKEPTNHQVKVEGHICDTLFLSNSHWDGLNWGSLTFNNKALFVYFHIVWVVSKEPSYNGHEKGPE